MLLLPQTGSRMRAFNIIQHTSHYSVVAYISVGTSKIEGNAEKYCETPFLDQCVLMMEYGIRVIVFLVISNQF